MQRKSVFKAVGHIPFPFQTGPESAAELQLPRSLAVLLPVLETYSHEHTVIFCRSPFSLSSQIKTE